MVLVWPNHYLQNISTLTDSEQCDDIVQDFDATVDHIEWQESDDDPTLPASQKTWHTVPPEKITANFLTPLPTDPTNYNVTFCRDLTDDEIAAGKEWGWGEWCNDAVDQDRTLDARNQRVLRYPASDPSTPQNGYSKLTLFWTKEPVYVCNTLMRYWTSCRFRPTRAQVPELIDLFQPWLRTNVPVPANRSAATQTVGLGWGANQGEGWGWIGNSIATAPRLAAFSCGVEHDGIYPKDPPYETRAINYRAWSYFGVNGRVVNPDQRFTEEDVLATLSQDVTLETDRFVGALIAQKGDYRELLTADWTVASGATELLARSAGFLLADYPPGAPDPADPSFLQLRRIRPGDYPPIPKQKLQNFWGSFYALRTWPIDGGLQTDIADLHARPLAGILTQQSFYDALTNNYKVRTLAAKIYRTLTCGELSAYAPKDPALHEQFVRNDNGGAHLDRSRGCYACHVNLDPLSSALTPAFADSGSFVRADAPQTAPLASEVWWPLLSSYAGSTGAPSDGAVFDKPVHGVREAAAALADSPEFARCVAQQTFSGIFGRPPDAGDADYVRDAVKRFMTGYDYDALVRDLVVAPQNWLEE
jgi:hypothetical protein